MYESKSDAKIRGLWADSKQLTVFLSCLLRQPVGFATTCRKRPKSCRKRICSFIKSEKYAIRHVTFLRFAYYNNKIMCIFADEI